MDVETVDRILDALNAGAVELAYALSEQALQAEPGNAHLWNVCGIAAQHGDRLEDAERCWRRSLELWPDADVTQQLAFQLLALGRDDEALACYQTAADNGSADALCWANLGLLRLHRQELAAAEAALRHALELDPVAAGTWANLGVLLAGSGKRLSEAEVAYRRALELEPDHVAALTNLGLTLELQRRHDEAEACQRRALALAPDRAEVHSHLAGVLARRQGYDGRYEAEAEHHYREALRLQPDDARNLSNLGAFFYDQNRIHESEEALRAALAKEPGLASARLNLGQLLLSMGRLPEGFQHTEMRYRLRVPGAVPGFPETPPPGAALQWEGQPLAGKRLLVWPEQGHGDQMQFCRYLRLVREQHRPAWITLASTDSLLTLMQALDGADRHIALQEAPAALQAHDYWVPVMSLPLYCGTTLDTIPGETPYFRPDPADVARWAPRIPTAPLKVGLVWRGNVNHDNDADRSLPSLSVLAPLWEVPGVVFVSLQKWAGEEEGVHPPGGQSLVHLGSDIESFADTAAILAQLDLLISVDTAACHLAGALDIPCWVMLPAYRNDWRWLRDRSDTPWYPRTRLFRQVHRGRWTDVMHQMKQALGQLKPVRDNLQNPAQGLLAT